MIRNPPVVQSASRQKSQSFNRPFGKGFLGRPFNEQDCQPVFLCVDGAFCLHMLLPASQGISRGLQERGRLAVITREVRPSESSAISESVVVDGVGASVNERVSYANIMCVKPIGRSIEMGNGRFFPARSTGKKLGHATCINSE